MTIETLLRQHEDRVVRAGLIGVGEFGATFVGQARAIRQLEVPVLCDRAPERAMALYRAAGRTDDQIRLCDSRAEALSAFEAGRAVVLRDSGLMMELPLDIVVEATGDPEAGAANAAAAIDRGKHVAMVTKEADSVVGPILAARARRAGLVYTLVDGDQPSLLIGLVARARLLGFEVVAAGKSSEHDFVYDPAAGTVTSKGVSAAAPGFAELWDPAPDAAVATLAERAARLAALEQRGVPDFCELLLVANATGLAPDRPDLHAPVARTLELPELLRPAAAGGLLETSGVVDVFNCLRRPDEVSFAGGVFVVAACPDRGFGRLLAEKGLPVSADHGHVLLHNPVHLLGAEAPVSVLAACLLGRATSGDAARPRHDLVCRAARALAAGTDLALGRRHEVEALAPELRAALPLDAGNPLPFYMAAGNRLAADVPAGALLSADMIEAPPDSVLWALRREQDAMFLAG